jgi:hypothetical protein
MKNKKIMKYETFVNNGKGDLITTEHIQKAIEIGNKIFVSNIEGLKNHNKKDEIEPIDIDTKNKIMVRDKEGNIGYTELNDVIEVLTQKTT